MKPTTSSIRARGTPHGALPGYHRLAEIDCTRADWTAALDHLDRSLRAEAESLNTRNLRTLVLRRLGRTAEAQAFLEANPRA